MGGIFTKIGNFFRSCWNGVKKFFKTAINLIINGIKKVCILIYEKNILNIRTSGKGRDLYAWAQGVKEEMEKNGINPSGNFSEIIENMKESNQNKELLYKIESRDIKDPIHSEEENEKLKQLNNKYNLNLDFKNEIIKISKYENFDDEQLQKLLSINFENVKNLELSYNNITTVNPLKGFQNWFPLEKLNLSYNKITKIDDLIECELQCLEELDISNNKIEYIDILTDSKFESLKKVNISSNNIKSDQERYIERLKRNEIEIIQ